MFVREMCQAASGIVLCTKSSRQRVKVTPVELCSGGNRNLEALPLAGWLESVAVVSGRKTEQEVRKSWIPRRCYWFY